MTRQVYELTKKSSGPYTRIISLKPINPKNRPDNWEKKALEGFKKGAEEEFTFVERDGKNFFRLVHSFVTKKECLKCHAIHGSKIGDIRGGISVTVSIDKLKDEGRRHIIKESSALLFLWIVGILVIIFLMKKQKYRVLKIKDLEIINEEFAASNEEYEAMNEELNASNEEFEVLNGELVEARGEIQASLDEKEILLKEIHHRVKNNFQIITSMINLQESSFSDEKVINALRIPKERIRAMSLIHERLYQSGNLSAVEDHKNALKEIVQEIALLGLFRSAFFNKAAFYGGTALRIFYGLNRFSEDLDFSLINAKKNFNLSKYTNFIENELGAYGFEMVVDEKIKSLDSAIRSAFIKDKFY